MSDEQDKDWEEVCALAKQITATIERARKQADDDLAPAQCVAALTMTIGDVLAQSCPDCARDVGRRAQGHLASIVEKITHEDAAAGEARGPRLH
jgi:hypothetical protein